MTDQERQEFEALKAKVDAHERLMVVLGQGLMLAMAHIPDLQGPLEKSISTVAAKMGGSGKGG